MNRFSSMIIDKIRRVVKAKQQETTEVRETTIHKQYETLNNVHMSNNDWTYTMCSRLT